MFYLAARYARFWSEMVSEKSDGFREVRRKGSHIVMQRKIEGSTITVPVPDHRELKLGTLLSIIRQSGLDRSAFES